MTTLRIPTDFTDAGWEKFKKAYEEITTVKIRMFKASKPSWFKYFQESWEARENLDIEIIIYDTKSGMTEILRDMDEEDFVWEDVQCDDEG